MLFTPVERVWISNIMPEKHSFAMTKIIREFREALSFDEIEISKYRVTLGGKPFKDEKAGKLIMVPEGQIMWDESFKAKEIHVPEIVRDLIVQQLKSMDSAKAIPMEMPPSIYERFVEKGERDEVGKKKRSK